MKIKQAKGITLIALVITIIVLLILAGVTISMLTGENGILKQATSAKDKTDKSEFEEQVKLAVMASKVNDEGVIDLTTLEAEIGKIKGTEITKNGTENNLPWTVKKGSYEVTITAEGTITTNTTGKDDSKKDEDTKIVNASDIASMSDKSKIYGATVNGYTLPSGTTTDVKWKIFYADNSNIYLIADNYVERANLPNSTTERGEFTTSKPNDGDSGYPRAAYFTKILRYYAGSARIKDSKIKALNNSYFNENNFTSTNRNMKSVAYMMDTTAWNSKFRDTSKAEYVVGGPTVELLFKSYNEKYKTAYESRASSETGYQIRKTSSDSWSNSIGSMLTTSDRLYVIESQSDASAMWVASPSAYNTGYVMYVVFNGSVDYYYYDYGNSGFRPLVSLKSDIQLQKNGDGTYTIL